jgi:hypothetical protein
MKKKSLLIRVLALVACISCAIGASAYSFEVNNIYYTITGTNTVEVDMKYYHAHTYTGDVTVPATVSYNGTTYRVTSVGELAFSECSGLTSVKLPNSVTIIKSQAFYGCRNLTSVDLGNSVTTIQANAFALCPAMTSVTIPNTVTTLDNGVFLCSGFTSIVIPNSVTSIPDNTFSGCTALTSVVIGSGVTAIGRYALHDCTALTNLICLATTPPAFDDAGFDETAYETVQLTVPKGSMDAYQTASNWNRFDEVSELFYDFEEGGIYYIIMDANTVAVTCLYLDDESVVSTYSGRVTIPSTVTHGGTTYQVTAIYPAAFGDCNNLTQVTIPNSVTYIGYLAFAYCTGLKYIAIPNSVIEVDEGAFRDCTSLEGVSLSNSMTDISNYMFIRCTSLKKVTIPNSVQEIGKEAFADCSSLTSVTIPASVEEIDHHVFECCPNLTSVICLGTTPPIVEYNAFDDDTYQNCKLIVPSSALRAYITADNWEDFENIDTLGSLGDVNGDGLVNITDVIDLIYRLLNN